MSKTKIVGNYLLSNSAKHVKDSGLLNDVVNAMGVANLYANDLATKTKMPDSVNEKINKTFLDKSKGLENYVNKWVQVNEWANDEMANISGVKDVHWGDFNKGNWGNMGTTKNIKLADDLGNDSWGVMNAGKEFKGGKLYDPSKEYYKLFPMNKTPNASMGAIVPVTKLPNASFGTNKPTLIAPNASMSETPIINMIDKPSNPSVNDLIETVINPISYLPALKPTGAGKTKTTMENNYLNIPAVLYNKPTRPIRQNKTKNDSVLTFNFGGLRDDEKYLGRTTNKRKLNDDIIKLPKNTKPRKKRIVTPAPSKELREKANKEKIENKKNTARSLTEQALYYADEREKRLRKNKRTKKSLNIDKELKDHNDKKTGEIEKELGILIEKKPKQKQTNKKPKRNIKFVTEI